MMFSILARINFNQFRLKPVFALVVVYPGVSPPACRMHLMDNHNNMVIIGSLFTEAFIMTMVIVINMLAIFCCCVTSELSEPAPQVVDGSGSTGPEMSFSKRCFGLDWNEN